jgi:hypothetical protein
MKTFPKLLVIGHARHGKDTVCEILTQQFGFNFLSSSRFCSQKFIFDRLKDQYGYATELECYEDRHNHRSEWFNLIHDYCEDDHSKLGREIFKEFDIYCGLRNQKEFTAMKEEGLFDYALWVDRSHHLAPESESSMTLTKDAADFIIDNNHDLETLIKNVEKLMNEILTVRS